MSLSLEDCKKVVQRFTKDESTAVAFKILPISESPVGFLGDHFRLFITYKTPQNRLLTSNFFFKTVPQGNPNHTEYVTTLGVFKKEALMYKYLLNDFQKHHDKLIAPKSYLVNPESYIILEDLSTKGFSMVDRVCHEGMLQVMKTMARFHSSSIIYEEQRSFPDKPYRLIEHFKDVLEEKTFSQVQGQPRYKWGMTTSKAVYDTILARSSNYQQIAEQFLQFARREIFDYVYPSKKYRNVANHADLWKNNIMFHGNKCVFIDFQLGRYTPPALDLMTMLHVNCTTDYLELHMKELLEMYYNTFKSCLENHGISIEAVFKDNEFEESLKHYEIASLTESAMFGTIIFIGQELAQKLASDERVFEEFNYTNRSNYTADELENNPEFESKYSDILSRLIDCLIERTTTT